MSVIRFTTVFIVFLFWSCQPNADHQYDVCIYGGTSAGVIAAYSAAKMGKTVILIEPGKHLGGLSSGGLGYTDIGNKYAITGLARDFYRRVGKRYGKFEQWIFEPHVAEEIFNDYIREAGVKVLFEHRIQYVEKKENLIPRITLEKTGEAGPKPVLVDAKMYIDCSYEGDLMARAGVSYTVGREPNNKYNETYNGVQLMSGHQFPDGVDPYRIRGDSTSGLLWGISDSAKAPDGTGDTKVQAYNYRICLSNSQRFRIPFGRPAGYDSTKYELLLRLFEAQPDKRSLDDYFIISRMPGTKTDINNRGGFSSDMIGMNYEYPEADYAARQEIIRQHEAYTKGLLYFYASDPRVPETLRKEMNLYGYAPDEYTDNDHWSPQLYIRESRRMEGAYVMTQANCEGREVVEDGVGMAAYTMDSHNCQRIVVNGMVKNEGNVEIGGFGPYPVSYRSLIPKEGECKNLVVPVCLSASHIAYGSIRMEPVFMALAQSAAMAACQAIDNEKAVQKVDVNLLRELLKSDPLLDKGTPEILVDNDDGRSVILNGTWERKTSEPEHGYIGNYGPSMLVAEAAAGKQEVTFTPSIQKAGPYDVLVYVPMIANSTASMRFIVFDGTSEREIAIDISSLQVEGQTSGEWVPLGRFSLPEGKQATVTIKTEGASGLVVADAVLFWPIR